MVDKTSVIPRLDDATLLSILEELHSDIPASEAFKVNIIGIQPIDLRSQDSAQRAIIERLRKPGSYLIGDASLLYHGLYIQYFRGGEPGRPSSPFTDEVKVSSAQHQQSLSAEQKLELLLKLNSRLQLARSIHDDQRL